MTQREGKVSFKLLRQRITGILNEEDPIGLIGLGCPADEYDPEIGTILPRLREASSAADLQRILHEEFGRWFSAETAGPAHRYAKAAHRIWELLQSESSPTIARAARDAPVGKRR